MQTVFWLSVGQNCVLQPIRSAIQHQNMLDCTLQCEKFVRRIRRNIEAKFYATDMLLTGMSDGGTFCYVSGLEAASPFTHLAPVSATFHPLMAEMADATRLQRLPIFITHGKLDWMFPVQTARQTQAALAAAGADVTYREIDDLSHTYPREINAELLEWLNGE